MEKLLRYAACCGKPYFLLLPNYVYTKPYYKTALGLEGKEAEEAPFYMVPLVRYWYWPPSWAAASGTSRGREKTSPFTSFWYCGGLGRERGGAIEWWQGRPERMRHMLRISVDEAALPKDVRGEFDDNKKRPNPKQRKRFAKLQRQAAAAGR